MRLLWVEILKLLAVFGVILLHVSAPYVVPFENTGHWWTGNIYDSLTRWCVPMFVMVSGALVLPGAHNIPFSRFLLVRVRRILVPFFIWSAIYFFYRSHIKGEELFFTGFLPMFISEPVFYHLWFVYMLFTLYLFSPVISAFLNGVLHKFAWYLIVIWFCWASFLPVLHVPLNLETYFMTDMNEYSALKLSGYFLLGFLLREAFVRDKSHLVLLLLVFLTGGAATAIGTFLLSLHTGEFNHFFYNYFSANVVLMTLSLFLLVKSIFNLSGKNAAENTRLTALCSQNLLQKAGSCVFGIYLIHALILELFRDESLGFVIDHTSFFGTGLPPAAGIPLFAASIFLFSLIVILILRAVPGLRNLIA